MFESRGISLYVKVRIQVSTVLAPGTCTIRKIVDMTLFMEDDIMIIDFFAIFYSLLSNNIERIPLSFEARLGGNLGYIVISHVLSSLTIVIPTIWKNTLLTPSSLPFIEYCFKFSTYNIKFLIPDIM